MISFSHEGNEYKLPIITGNDAHQYIDVTQLYQKTKLYTYDHLLKNTAIAQSSITSIDLKTSTLRYRGYNIEDLVSQSSFPEVVYLLINGDLPNNEEYKNYLETLTQHNMVHEAMKNFFDGFPGDAHPLAILATMVTALSSYYPETYDKLKEEGVDLKARLLSKVGTLAAWAYKKSIGQPVIYPRDYLPYCANFLHMMFALPVEKYEVSPESEKILNQILILYSDHEQNISTSTVRLVGSTLANLFVCINAGISALWGLREASSKFDTMSMLSTMQEHNMKPEKFFEKFINGEESFHSSAFGHKKYSAMEARAKVAHTIFHDLVKQNTTWSSKSVISLALEVEEFVLGHPYFLERGLLPNLDFYSGLLLSYIGIPKSMFNVVRVIGKLGGWLAHWDEQQNVTKDHKSHMRPQQIYIGHKPRDFIEINKRS